MSPDSAGMSAIVNGPLPKCHTPLLDTRVREWWRTLRRLRDRDSVEGEVVALVDLEHVDGLGCGQIGVGQGGSEF